MGLEIGRSPADETDEAVELTAAFLIDATGPGGALTRAFGVPADADDLLTNSWSVYSHFADVERFESLYRFFGGDAAAHPYPCDDAALHHVLADGWVFVLRFNNGLTSAGPVMDGTRRRPNGRPHPGGGMASGPADVIRPWGRSSPRPGRCGRSCAPAGSSGGRGGPSGRAGRCCRTRPTFSTRCSAAATPTRLLGVERLGRLFREHWGRPSLDAGLAEYERTLFREVAFLDRLIHGSYQAFGRFDLLATYTMYYFAGAIHSEGRRRRGEAGPGDEFLFSHHPLFRAALWRAHAALGRLVREPAGRGEAEFRRQVAGDIADFNSAGLCDPAKNNLYPFV